MIVSPTSMTNIFKSIVVSPAPLYTQQASIVIHSLRNRDIQSLYVLSRSIRPTCLDLLYLLCDQWSLHLLDLFDLLNRLDVLPLPQHLST